MAELTNAQKEALFQEWTAKQEAETARKAQLMNVSAFSYGGTLMSIDLFEGKPKIDKATNLPILDSMGQQTFWDSSYYCLVAHLGSSRKFVVPLEIGKDLEKGQAYLFEGELADVDNKLKVKTVQRI